MCCELCFGLNLNSDCTQDDPDDEAAPGVSSHSVQGQCHMCLNDEVCDSNMCQP